jgi:hypothetical protein
MSKVRERGEERRHEKWSLGEGVKKRGEVLYTLVREDEEFPPHFSASVSLRWMRATRRDS